jgi:hypothetical protein
VPPRPAKGLQAAAGWIRQPYGPLQSQVHPTSKKITFRDSQSCAAGNTYAVAHHVPTGCHDDGQYKTLNTDGPAKTGRLAPPTTISACEILHLTHPSHFCSSLRSLPAWCPLLLASNIKRFEGRSIYLPLSSIPRCRIPEIQVFHLISRGIQVLQASAFH